MPDERIPHTLQAIVLVDSGGLARLLEIHDRLHVAEAGRPARDVLEHALDRRDDREDTDWTGKERATINRFIRRATHYTHDAGPSHAHDHDHRPGTTILNRLRATAATDPDGPDPDLCRRIDHLVPRLARSHRAGAEAALKQIIRHWRQHPPATAAHACDQLETLLHDWPAQDATSDTVTSTNKPTTATPVRATMRPFASASIEVMAMILVQPPKPE